MNVMSNSIWRPFTQMGNLSNSPLPRVVKARGAKLFLEDGRELIDGISSWWVINHGHCHPEVVSAVQAQANRLDQVLFGNFSHETAEALVDSLREMLPLQHFFFSDNGSTAVEVALKMSLQACKQRGAPERNRFVAFEHAYHGDTAGAMSVGGRGLFTALYDEMLFEVIRAQQGTKISDGSGVYVEDFKEKMEQQGERVAAVIIEPLMQGAGGMIPWPREALEEVVRVAKRHGAFVIFDEVMTGFGRTGKNFAFDHIDENPDLLCLSKGLTGGCLPMALTVATSEIYDCFMSREKSKMFFHGHSFTANPIACAAALANSKLMKEPSLPAKWERIHSIHTTHIEQYKAHPHVIDTRVCGTIAAIELKSKQTGYESPLASSITQSAMAQGVFLRPLGNVLYLLPPYCISPDELKHVWSVISSCIDSISED